ncbi:MAG: hypothetical protein HY267_04720 [Deltaproteobacteria bacterium]|nr:hypothetical protein [Deltaproteobacteria bacterium]
MKTCHHCQQEITVKDRIGRREACASCGADLRCCLNCLLYDPHYANACREPNADPVLDKEAGNFCEHFAFVEIRQPQKPATASSARAQLEALFRKK